MHQGHITCEVPKLHKFYDEQTTIEGFTKTKLFEWYLQLHHTGNLLTTHFCNSVESILQKT